MQEWSDGQFSWIMRTLANIEGNAPKWIVLDGDIDPMWIESLNTVMDDNKVIFQVISVPMGGEGGGGVLQSIARRF